MDFDSSMDNIESYFRYNTDFKVRRGIDNIVLTFMPNLTLIFFGNIFGLKHIFKINTCEINIIKQNDAYSATIKYANYVIPSLFVIYLITFGSILLYSGIPLLLFFLFAFIGTFFMFFTLYLSTDFQVDKIQQIIREQFAKKITTNYKSGQETL